MPHDKLRVWVTKGDLLWPIKSYETFLTWSHEVTWQCTLVYQPLLRNTTPTFFYQAPITSGNFPSPPFHAIPLLHMRAYKVSSLLQNLWLPNFQWGLFLGWGAPDCQVVFRTDPRKAIMLFQCLILGFVSLFTCKAKTLTVKLSNFY